ncbi:hypothetical protein [Vibrio europaeus]|uniref:hypothetical protein n=1 Tax=Vibrio europaeus TaxID=300876 RepID=UPI0020A5CE28|nr:hypothetical protein [Vibrio europaeus]
MHIPPLSLYAKVIVCTALSVISHSAAAVEWQVSGFGTLGYAYESEDNLAYRRDITHPADISDNGSFVADSNFGLQLDANFNRQWSVTTQWLLDKSVENDFNEVTELAFIRYVPNEHWGFRVGRIGVSAYSAADSRDIDFAHLWVRPPQELYGGIVFNSLDGVGLSYFSNNSEFNWSIKLEYGHNEQMGEVPQTIEAYTAELEDVLSASFEVEQGHWAWQLSYAHVNSLSVIQGATTQALQSQLGQLAALNIPMISQEAATANELMGLDGEEIDYYQMALHYFDGLWTIKTELFHIQAKKESIPQGYGGYALLGYNINSLTPYAIYSRFDPDHTYFSTQSDWSAVNPSFALLQSGAEAGINSVRIDQQTYSFGVRWDVTAQIALKAQFDYVDIEDFGYGLWASDAAIISSGRDVQVYTLNLNFVF